MVHVASLQFSKDPIPYTIQFALLDTGARQSTDRLEFSARNNTEGLQMNPPIEFENTLKSFVRKSKRVAVFDMYAR